MHLMTSVEDFEYYVLKHYMHKGVFARTKIIKQLIEDLRNVENKENYDSKPREGGLNDDEIISAYQIAIISHIMMFIEDVAAISKSISEGKVEYYSYLDKEDDEDLGKVIGLFYGSIIKAPDESFRAMLSYSDLKNFEFANESQKIIIENIIKKIIENVRKFFIKVALFRQNHQKIFRRYKHAGFPILLTQKIPDVMKEYVSYSFVAVGITSRENIAEELVPIPYSKKAIQSYEIITSEILSFLGIISSFKTICIERKVSGIIPNIINTFGVKLTEEENQVLKQVWENFETKHPFDSKKSTFGIATKSEILKWYTEIDKSLVRTI